jgi:hypothetical protein
MTISAAASAAEIEREVLICMDKSPWDLFVETTLRNVAQLHDSRTVELFYQSD